MYWPCRLLLIGSFFEAYVCAAHSLWWGQCCVFVRRELSVMLCLWSLTELFLMSALKLHRCSRPVEVRPLGPGVCLRAAICRSLAHLRVSTTFLFIFSVSGRWSSLELWREWIQSGEKGNMAGRVCRSEVLNVPQPFFFLGSKICANRDGNHT